MICTLRNINNAPACANTCASISLPPDGLLQCGHVRGGLREKSLSDSGRGFSGGHPTRPGRPAGGDPAGKVQTGAPGVRMISSGVRRAYRGTCQHRCAVMQARGGRYAPGCAPVNLLKRYARVNRATASGHTNTLTRRDDCAGRRWRDAGGQRGATAGQRPAGRRRARRRAGPPPCAGGTSSRVSTKIRPHFRALASAPINVFLLRNYTPGGQAAWRAMARRFPA